MGQSNKKNSSSETSVHINRLGILLYFFNLKLYSICCTQQGVENESSPELFFIFDRKKNFQFQQLITQTGNERSGDNIC